MDKIPEQLLGNLLFTIKILDNGQNPFLNILHKELSLTHTNNLKV